MEKASIQVNATLEVSVQFRMELDRSLSLADAEKAAREAAERVANGVIGLRGTDASASVQRINRFSMVTAQ